MASRRSTYRKCKYIKEAKKAKKKVIVHVHGAEFKVFYDKECNESQKRYIKECLNMCDKIIVLSEESFIIICAIVTPLMISPWPCFLQKYHSSHPDTHSANHKLHHY